MLCPTAEGAFEISPEPIGLGSDLDRPDDHRW
jgi:hypothetical protein